MKSIVGSLWIPFAALMAVAVFFLTFYGMGRAGYQAGARVTVGFADLDPEMVRALTAMIMSLVSAALTWLVTRFPWLDMFLSLIPKPSPVVPSEPVFGGLTAEQDARLTRLTLLTADMSERNDIVHKRIEEAIARVEAQTKPQVMP